jgi:aminoglycoside phosphotransferase (APT) family kinase protein
MSERGNDAAVPFTGVHLPYVSVPEAVKAWVESAAGAAVLAVADLDGGFSPGCCTLLALASGRRVFVKAVGTELNPDSPAMHRREAQIATALPRLAQVPRLLDTYDDGDWVALMFDEVTGAPPRRPWDRRELDRVLADLATLHRALTPAPIAVERMSERQSAMLRGWRALAESASLEDVDDWSRRHLDRLVELEADCPGALDAGDTLLHGDIRSDNLLIGASSTHFVDWPHAAIGTLAFDLVGWAPSVVLEGGPDPEALLARYGDCGCDSEAVRAMVAGVAGYFTHHATLPAPRGLPTVRAFQAAQGEVARAWLRRQTGWR